MEAAARDNFHDIFVATNFTFFGGGVAMPLHDLELMVFFTFVFVNWHYGSSLCQVSSSNQTTGGKLITHMGLVNPSSKKPESSYIVIEFSVGIPFPTIFMLNRRFVSLTI
jgi:hypothetical protein